MPTCPKCGAEHDLLDPTFRRAEAFVRLDTRSQGEHAFANDDLCRISIPDTASCYFVRGTLPVTVEDHSEGIRWGLWAEISESDFHRTLKLWSDADQASEPPFEGALANVIPSYPNTLGIPLRIQLTGPTSRPEFRFGPDTDHPFVRDCQSGVDAHRASQWSKLIEVAP
jgi:hypothetical protein